MSSVTDNCQIIANADIDGIGIRISLYAQAAITLLIFIISPNDTTFDSWWSTLVTALSLQLAALVSAHEISLYHAILVTWLSFPALIMSFAFYGLFYFEGNAPLTLLILTYVHTCTFLAFTIWAWSTSPTFPCSHAVHLVVFGQHVRVAGWFRYPVIAIVSIWAFGVAVASILYVFSWIASLPAVQKLSTKFRDIDETLVIPPTPPEEATTRNERVLGGAFTAFAFLLMSTVTAELMISSHDVLKGDGTEWGYGQIVAMVLLLTPAFAVVRAIRDDYRNKGTKPLEDRPLASLWRNIRRRYANPADASAAAEMAETSSPEAGTADKASVEHGTPQSSSG